MIVEMLRARGGVAYADDVNADNHMEEITREVQAGRVAWRCHGPLDVLILAEVSGDYDRVRAFIEERDLPPLPSVEYVTL